MPHDDLARNEPQATQIPANNSDEVTLQCSPNSSNLQWKSNLVRDIGDKITVKQNPRDTTYDSS